MHLTCAFCRFGVSAQCEGFNANSLCFFFDFDFDCRQKLALLLNIEQALIKLKENYEQKVSGEVVWL